MMTSHQYQGFYIILAHAREEAKNEVRSKIFIYEPLKCTWSIYIVHAVNINTTINLFYAKRSTFHKHIELTSKVITQVFADESVDLKSSGILFL